jgi:3'(2'), 5'-bisphosphate nucleotidase
MPIKSYSKEVETALRAVKDAAMLCRALVDEVDENTLQKMDKSPVTIADYGSQALVLKTISDVFPEASVIAEEDSSALTAKENRQLLEKLVATVKMIRSQADADTVLSWIDWGKSERNPDYFWTLDPIDGTKGFLRHDQYAISLCLIVKGTPTVAALGCPRLMGSAGKRGAVFFAVKGEGAFELPLSMDGEPMPVKVSDVSDITQIRFSESVESAHSSHNDSARIADKLGIQSVPCRIDSQTKYAAVARGNGDAYLGLPTDPTYRDKIWDHAGGTLLVQEAGGNVTDVKGRQLDFRQGPTLKNNIGIIATNSKIHNAIIDAIKNLGIGEFDVS